MREHSHTLIAVIRRAVAVWRKREGWSRETVTQCIVEAYVACDGEALTGIRFGGHSLDAYERTKTDADRMFRWLDDEGKDNNLLPPNMVPFVLAALPLDLRIMAVSEILLPTGLSVHVSGRTDGIDLVNALQHVAKECGEATSALAGLMDGAQPGELERAAQELSESIAAQEEARRLVEERIAAAAPVRVVA